MIRNNPTKEINKYGYLGFNIYNGIIVKGVSKCPKGKTVPIKPEAEPCSFLLIDNERIETFPGLASPPPKPYIANSI
jgi:hypothetical protein